MTSEINKGLRTLWKAEPLTFPDFQFVSYPDALQLILNLPKEYSKTAGFLDDNIEKPPKPAKSPNFFYTYLHRESGFRCSSEVVL